MGAKMAALLSVKNLSIVIRKNFSSGSMNSGRTKLLGAVEDVSFDIYPGEIVGLAGESGSGKSLTAFSIPGLLDENRLVSHGFILYFGDNSGKTNRARDLLTLTDGELQSIRGKEISMIFQEPFSSLNPLVKIGDQIAETLLLHGEKDKGRIKKQVLEFMDKLKLPNPEKLIDSYPHNLSGGMCQRVMIALAMICRPRLLIADEPTTALDQDTQSQIISMMKEINRDFGTSILFISHDLGLIRDFCGRLLVMYGGRILEEGNTAEIFENPAHEYTKGLLRCIPNKANKGKDLAVIPGRIPSLEEGRPRGCPFHPRCQKARPECKQEFPPARTVSSNHTTHCVTWGMRNEE